MNEPYLGEQKLVFSIDIGTTNTAVSIVHLQPGVPPKVRVISRWPGDTTSSKIPSLILFVWRRLSDSMAYVIATPNGWGLAEQAVLKAAMEGAGLLVKDAAASEDRLVFVTEAEASVHFGLHYAPSSSSGWLEPGAQFAVCDAGGSTVDSCVYEVESTTPKLRLREVKTSDCVQAGAIFPTRFARSIIEAKLAGSKFCTKEYLDAIVETFDSKTKHHFAEREEAQVIKFGFDKDNDKAVGISRGRLTLTGAEVARAFEPCVAQILSSLDGQIAGCNVKNILLVGGFGESPYLRRTLAERYEPHGIKIVTADEPSKKAVSEGASLFYIKDCVIARATRFDFGIQTTRKFSQWGDLALGRPVFTAVDGQKRIDGGWSRIIKKGTVIESNQLVTEVFNHTFRSRLAMVYSVTLRTCDHDSSIHDGWMTDRWGKDINGFERCCTLTADLSSLATPDTVQVNEATGEPFWHLTFKVGLAFGGTSLKAYVLYDENGVEKRGPASVIPSIYY
ncbi:hypothetical protein RQP46_005340 [Phenoliferia psychrophenolica]